MCCLSYSLCHNPDARRQQRPGSTSPVQTCNLAITNLAWNTPGRPLRRGLPPRSQQWIPRELRLPNFAQIAPDARPMPQLQLTVTLRAQLASVLALAHAWNRERSTKSRACGLPSALRRAQARSAPFCSGLSNAQRKSSSYDLTSQSIDPKRTDRLPRAQPSVNTQQRGAPALCLAAPKRPTKTLCSISPDSSTQAQHMKATALRGSAPTSAPRQRLSCQVRSVLF